MKQTLINRRTDVVLSAAAVAVVVLAAAVVFATGRTEELVAWAWERHHNVLSWYIRPLFFLPFCLFAYKRSLLGITLTVVALATSISWFPAPEQPSPAVMEMLASEKAYLTGDWTLWKVLVAMLIPLTFLALGLTFWRRSLLWGLSVINGAVLFKIVWTFVFSTEAGALSHLPAAVLGLVACNALLLLIARRLSSQGRQRPAEYAGGRAGEPSATQHANSGTEVRR